MAATWKVAQLERKTASPANGVIVVHWRCEDKETVGEGDSAVDHYGSAYGSVSFVPDSSKSDYITWSKLTEEDCIAWVKASEDVDVDEIEKSIAAQITESKTPTSKTGVPW
jgi:hypothetical protein|tara:strand:- start:626 stop:958 length:333 start_codon:yes stop_codon:yes gene_type:complete